MMRKLAVGLGLIAVALAPGAARAQFALGVQGSWADDFDLGIGARGSFDFRQVDLPVMLIGSYDYFFPGEEVGVDPTYWEANLNVGYVNQVNPRLATWVGAGLNYANLERNDTKVLDRVGLNLLAGAKVYFGNNFAALGEGRFEVEGGEQLVLTLGVEYIVRPSP